MEISGAHESEDERYLQGQNLFPARKGRVIEMVVF